MKTPEVPTIVDLDMASIRPRRYARRLIPKCVGRLSQSIKGIGLQVPIIVRAINGGEGTSKKFEILAGHHRYAACRVLQMKTIPCIIRALDDLRAVLITIDENLCRENLTPAQEAAAIKRRKEIYEALHPETKRGAIGGGHQSRQIGDTVKATLHRDHRQAYRHARTEHPACCKAWGKDWSKAVGPACWYLIGQRR